MVKKVLFKHLVMAFSTVMVLIAAYTVTFAPQAGSVPPPSRVSLTAKNTSCYPGLCTCTTKTADCSRNFGRLGFLPELPKGIKRVIFSFNNLTAIRDDDFFQNVSMIQYLDLQSNGLEYISQGAFRVLSLLRILYLDYNRLSYAALVPVFDVKGLSTLRLTYMGLGPLPRGYFSRKFLPPLARLDLSNNYIHHLDMSELEPLKYLLYLRAVHSRISQVTTVSLPQLKFLDLGSNALLDLPDSCSGNGSSLFPGLKELRFGKNSFSGFQNQVCLPNLDRLDLSGNQISTVKTDMFNRDRFPSLGYLKMESMGIRTLEAFAFRSPTLWALSLMFCNIQFSQTAHPDSLAGIPNLESLQASHNLATSSSEGKFIRLIRSLNNLKKLFLGSCGINSISRDTFAGSPRLTRLYLYNNMLTTIPDGAFDALENLTELSLGFNQIHVIHEKTFSPATRTRLRHLDLSGNPFVCDCDLLWFEDWFKASSSVFNEAFNNYTCANIPDTPLKNFKPVEQACLLSEEVSKAIMGSVFSVLIILTIVSVVYQHRWHIRLMLAFRGHGEIMRRRLQEENFTYDVFVSSAEEDEAWVLEELLPKLEGRLALRVCFHKRDFVPGKNILNNIVDSVKGSKKFLMVFSKDFAASRWCQFELDLCLGHVFDNDDDLIVTCLDDVASRDLTSAMTAVLRTTTYIQWPHDPCASASFWRRLERALHQILP